MSTIPQPILRENIIFIISDEKDLKFYYILKKGYFNIVDREIPYTVTEKLEK
jgi:hypothetical protein